MRVTCIAHLIDIRRMTIQNLNLPTFILADQHNFSNQLATYPINRVSLQPPWDACPLRQPRGPHPILGYSSPVHNHITDSSGFLFLRLLRLAGRTMKIDCSLSVDMEKAFCTDTNPPPIETCVHFVSVAADTRVSDPFSSNGRFVLLIYSGFQPPCHDTATCRMTRDGVWIGNCIYWPLTDRNYKKLKHCS
jgi:hypothetical protein